MALGRKNRICVAIIGASLFGMTDVSAQTVIGPGGKGNEFAQLTNGAFVGQTFVSPGGNLLSFSFTDTSSGVVPTGFYVAAFSVVGIVGAPLFQSTLSLVSGSTTIDNINLATTAGASYIAYLSNGSDSAPGFANIAGYVGDIYPTNTYAGGSELAYYTSNPTGSQYSTYDRNDTAFTATFGELTAAVPEPAAWSMILVGFGAVGGAMRRSQKTSTTVELS